MSRARSVTAVRPRTRRPNNSRPVRQAWVHVSPDAAMFGAVAGLVGIGLIMVFSASSVTAARDFHDATYYLKRQLTWLVIGMIASIAVFRMDYHKLKNIAAPAMVVNTVMLLLVLIPHIGLETGGARRWLGVGALSIQPSEFAKLTLVLYLAAVLSQSGGRIRDFSKGMAPLAIATAIMAALVLKEPDMGTASLIMMTAATMFYVAGARLSHLFLLAMIALPPAAITVLSSTYKRARVLAFLDPWKDPQNTGFHIVQSLLALGSGGVFGLGLGVSRQKFFWLPEPYTDFIFSILGEELGLIGELAVLGLFVVFAYRAIRIAVGATDRFGFFLAVGCTAVIIIQALINVGVVTSSWPVTGVPLPFISFGGSSLVVNLVAVALLMNIGRRRRIS
jgi:cell division protein FtsW